MTETSYLDRVTDFVIRSDEFTNDKGETIKYKQIVLKVEVDGEEEELVLSGSNPMKPKFVELTLKSAKSQ